MSQTTIEALEDQEIIDAFIHAQINNYNTAIMTTLLLYTYVLTFDEECFLIWKHRKAFSSLLFVAFRYFPRLAFIVDQIRFYVRNNGSSGTSLFLPGLAFNFLRGLWWPRLIAATVITACTGPILILRVQALYDRANWVLGILIPAYLCQLAIIVVDPNSLYLGLNNVQMSPVITGVLVTRLLFNIKHAALKSRYNTSFSMPNLDSTINSTNHSRTHNSGLITHDEQIAKYSTAGKFGTTALRTMIDLDIRDLGADIHSITDD
ncbi:hypothetical protein M422DRAFT_270999 [Sphaerobolus stellatus SS14]|uniref:DUF6533 domain-containing protein n=1 Tax=Sphaerobolus stellatus (strain SS14) TaxID=990650 RepID=A0A0C9UR55_SPHS4|nr:hypothetical protein M422DRAFT_270999 [Sphaerobolus stellatus SS14]